MLRREVPSLCVCFVYLTLKWGHNINLPHVIKIAYLCHYSLQKLSQFLFFFFFFTFVKDADYFFIMSSIMLCNNKTAVSSFIIICHFNF